jgi:hypothetical protein
MERGGDLNVVSKIDGGSLLLQILQERDNFQEEFVVFLVQNGANVNAYFYMCEGVMHLAAANLLCSVKICKFLLNAGASLGPDPYSGITPLMYMCAECPDQPEKMRFLIDSGSPIDHVCKEGRTALHSLAEEDEYSHVLRDFLRYANPNASLGKKETALMIAAKLGANENVKLLVHYCVNKTDEKGRTALEIAAVSSYGSNLETFDILVKNGGIFRPNRCPKALIHPLKLEYFKKYPEHFIDALLRHLGLELSILVTNANNLPSAIRNKVDLEYGNDIHLFHVFRLPYHRLQDGILFFLKMCGSFSGCFKSSIDTSRVPEELLTMCKALALAAHNTSAAREMAERHAKQSEFKKT